MGAISHTPTPWKASTEVKSDNGYIYVSVQPVTPDEDRDKALAMANGEFHVCRMSHTAARWRVDQHQANAVLIVKAVNAHDAMVDALKGIISNPGGRCTAAQWQAGLDALAKAGA